VRSWPACLGSEWPPIALDEDSSSSIAAANVDPRVNLILLEFLLLGHYPTQRSIDRSHAAVAQMY
jgi:hypothetical protein